MTAENTQTLPAFINDALYGANGYYATAQVKFGPDFVTFAEKWAPLLAERFFLMWKAMVAQGEIKRSEIFHIYEFGAGSGKMAKCILEYIHGKSRIECDGEWPDFFKAVKYIIGEISPELLKQQQGHLRKYHRQQKVDFFQTDARLPDHRIPPGAGVVVTNELIDAFPPHEITLTETGEIFATVIDSRDNILTTRQVPYKSVLSDSEIAFVDTVIEKSKPLSTLPRRFYIQPSLMGFYEKLSTLLTKGYVVTLDYGDHAQGYFKQNNALRTFSHAHGNNTSFLTHKGKLDITVDVNFSDVALAGERRGFEFAYYGLQDAIGGPYLPEFKILFQRRNISSVLDAVVFDGMELTSPLRYENMQDLDQTLNKGEKLLSKTFEIISALKNRINQNQIAQTEAILLATERFIGQLDSALTAFLAWLETQNYTRRNKAFMGELDGKYFGAILGILTLMENQQFLTTTTIIVVLTKENKEFAEMLITPVISQRYRTVNEKDPLERLQFKARLATTERWVKMMAQEYRFLIEQMYKKRMMREYNFDMLTSASERKGSILSRYLAAASEDNMVAIKTIPVRHLLLKNTQQKEIELLLSLPEAKAALP